MIWATFISMLCFCWLYSASSSSAVKNIINLMLVLTIWWCPCVGSTLMLLERVVCYKQCVLTLAISCLTMSNLPWFMYLTVQIPMQYCSLQHWTLVSPPDTSTTEHHSCFGPAVSFLLELLEIALHSSPVAHWTLSNLGREWGAHFPVSYFFASFYYSRGSHGKNTGINCHFLLQGTLPTQGLTPCLLCLLN